ncbi:patatin-like phospholipase family protein [Thalassomonas viridans]|uniref:Patatin-like phospholipase family protein n=1 Tax=Thalassomonas viridans TaxID=137584 RepID=A0AAF0CB02_9GAMM|nr:CBASS cGAMP-activated phospholipase [Thalassomonas viridans]WDE06284.1 patatin-like phospholipase family protein [Thalassomonas viridans]
MTAKAYRVLALSGGGYRGLYTATVLAGLEEHTGRQLYDCCDLLCGTSIGGIIAIGLAAGLKSKDMAKAFVTHGGKIFNKGAMRSANVWTAKYNARGLERTLELMFGKALVFSELSKIGKPFFLTAVNLNTGATELISNTDRDYEQWTVMDAARATSAAPVYFPLKEVNGVLYADGGVGCNVPDMAAFSFSSRKFQKEPERIHMLSVGTGYADAAEVQYTQLKADSGYARWGTKLVDIVGDAQRNLIIEQCENMTARGRYLRLDCALPRKLALDETSIEATKMLIKAGNNSVNQHMQTPFIQSFFI